MASKLGPHVLSITPAALSWSHVAPLVKCVDQIEPFEVASNAAMRIFRHYLPDPQPTDGVVVAQAVINSLQGYRHPNLFLEMWNEQQFDLVEAAKAAAHCHAAGYQVAIGSWATGTYSDAQFTLAQVAHADLVAIHAYWDPGKLDVWEAYRYRQCWKPGQPRVIITECGRRLGWTPLAELQQYDAEIAKDAFVVGATPFTCGPWFFPNVDPQAFNVDSIVPQLMAGGQHMPNIGPGMRKAIPFLGQPIEDQVYHFAGSDHEVGIAVFEFGHATWSKKDNETWAHCDDGRAWRDFGNHSKNGGQMVAVSGPF